MNLDKNTSRHILFAQQLLKIIEDNPSLLKENNLMKLEKDMFLKLSTDEFVDILRTLNRRDAIEFENKDDLLGLSYGREDFIWVYIYKENLYKFIKLADENLYGLDLKNKERVLSILKKLNSLIHAKHDKNNQIKIAELKEGKFLEEKDIKIIEWIADYSGSIKIVYKFDADFDYDELGRYKPVGASEFPEKVEVVNIDGLKQLYEKLKKELLLSEEEQFKLIDLKNNIEWRCAKCSRFLDRLASKEQVENYIVDFMIGKYKICHKCRKRNYFQIDKNGKVSFHMI